MVVGNASPTVAPLERLAPGTPLRQGLERIIQQGKGAIIVLGSGADIEALSSGGFMLVQPEPFSPAKLAELAKMDGGIVLDDGVRHILAANVHFVPAADIATDETGSRHRTAQRIARQTRRPVVAVSEGRKVATLYIDGQKIELRSATEVGARVNQELQTLDRLRRRLDDAEATLTQLEVVDLSTHRAVVTLIQRAELVRRVGLAIEREAVSLGDDGRLAYVQLVDMVRGVEHLISITLRDYSRTMTKHPPEETDHRLRALDDAGLEDPARVARAVGISDLDEPASPCGYRVLTKVGRLPESVLDQLVAHFEALPKMIVAEVDELERVEGIGPARASHLRHYFDRLRMASDDWTPRAP